MKIMSHLKIAGLLTILSLAAFTSNTTMLYAASGKTSVTQSQPVNINRASAIELEAVRGIGPKLAERIINYREEYGQFESFDDLVGVRGIGQAKLQKIKAQISM